MAAVNLKAVAAAVACLQPKEAPRLDATTLGSRPVCYEETTTGWFSYWAAALDSAPRPHRKLWEFAAALQAMFDRGLLIPGARALGIGVGDEPMASSLAGLGLSVTATDLPEALDRTKVWRPRLISEADFDAHVALQTWDPTRQPSAEGASYDIVWSCGVLNALDDFEQAESLVRASRASLKPGGWAFHTFDLSLQETAATDFLCARQVAALAAEPPADETLRFDLGDHPLDGYVDIPPFAEDESFAFPALFSDRGGTPHLKVLLGGRAVTSYLLVLPG